MVLPLNSNRKAYNTKLANAITMAYFIVALIEIAYEYLGVKTMLMVSKPLLMPLLAMLYVYTSPKVDKLFLIALFCNWVANMFFISSNFDFIIVGTLFFTSYRILIIALVLKLVRLPGVLPLLVGALPFLFIYLFVMSLAYDELQEGFWLFVVQGIFTIVYGGLSLGVYIFQPNKANTYLLISTMFFTFTQFLFVIRLFYVSSPVFQPMSMLLFVAAHYLFYKFLLREENKLQPI